MKNVSRAEESLGIGSYSGSSYSSDPLSGINGGVVAVVAIVAFIIAIILLITVIERKKAPRGKFLKWLREYLNFRSILVSGIIKFVYAFLAVFLTIMSVVVMCQGRDEMVLPMIGIGFAMMIFGNIFLRVMLELTMALIVVWENTSDIRGVIVKEEEKLEEKEPKKPAEPKELVIAEKPVEEKPVEAEKSVEPEKPVVAEVPTKPETPAQPTEPVGQ